MVTTIDLPGQTFWGDYVTRDGTEVRVRPRVGGGGHGERPHQLESWDMVGNHLYGNRDLDLMRAVKPKERY